MSRDSLTVAEASYLIVNAERETEELCFDRARAEMVRVESQILNDLSDAASLLDLRRAIAVTVFRMSFSKNCTAAVCQHWFDKCDELGFGHVSAKFEMSAILARVYAHWNDFDAAQSVLTQMKKELESAEPRDEFIERDLQQVGQMLNQIQEEGGFRPF